MIGKWNINPRPPVDLLWEKVFIPTASGQTLTSWEDVHFKLIFNILNPLKTCRSVYPIAPYRRTVNYFSCWSPDVALTNSAYFFSKGHAERKHFPSTGKKTTTLGCFQKFELTLVSAICCVLVELKIFICIIFYECDDDDLPKTKKFPTYAGYGRYRGFFC